LSFFCFFFALCIFISIFAARRKDELL